jgi:hypothetical protein
MNVRLNYELEFLAGIYFNDQLLLNRYSVSINLLTNTADSASTNIALDRIKCLVASQFENTVFVKSDQLERAEMMSIMGINITTLPEDPVDQIVGIMLFNKFNAVMEDRMQVVALDICSTQGDGVWYQHDTDDSLGPFGKTGWWNEPTLQHNDIELEPVVDNVVKVKHSDWLEYELMWPDLDNCATNNTVVFGKFPKNEN